MTGDAPFGLNGSMLVNKRSLLVCVTFKARGVSAGRKSCLFEFKPAVWIVTITTLHCAFQHLVMKRQIELVLRLTMTTETKLRLAILQQLQIGDTGLLRVCSRDEYIRGRQLPSTWLRMCRVTVSATDVVAPVLAATEVVVFLSTGVTP